MDKNGRHRIAEQGDAPERLLGVAAIIILVATAIAALAWRALGTEAGVTYLAMGAFAALAANWGLALGFAELETRNSRVYSVPKTTPA